ncbi:MAG: efflux RND transporter periplasmic adaptor subunit [Thermoanaerobaculia bacterium]
MTKATTLALILTASLLTLACGKATETKAPESLSGISIETASLAPADDAVEALGTIRSTTIANLSAKTVGNVTQILVSEGDRVKAGQLLLTIDDRDIAAQQRKAGAGLDETENAIAGADAGRVAAASQAALATATYNRFVQLRERGSVSPQEFEEVEARYRAAVAQKTSADRMYDQMVAKRSQARADADSAAAMLSWTRITSPVDGVVTAKNADVGMQAMPGMSLLTVESTSGYRLDTTVDESRIGSIKQGGKARVTVDSTGAVIDGTIEHVSPALDPSSRSYVVKVSLPPTEGLASGMSARARIKIGETTTISVPKSALVFQGQLTGIWGVDPEGIAHLRFVQTGRDLGERVEVLSGLGDGDRYASPATAALRDGVKIAEPAAKGTK